MYAGLFKQQFKGIVGSVTEASIGSFRENPFLLRVSRFSTLLKSSLVNAGGLTTGGESSSQYQGPLLSRSHCYRLLLLRTVRVEIST